MGELTATCRSATQRWVFKVPPENKLVIPMNLLLSAFACLPNYGTESGNGWNTSVHLAKAGHTVYVLTRATNRERIQAYLKDNPEPNIHFLYVELPLARMFRYRDRGLYYIGWQVCAFLRARRLLRTTRIELIHHVTYGSIHMLSRLCLFGVPFVFGPVGGGQTAPESMLSLLGKASWKERMRTTLTRLLPYSPLHRFLLQRMSVVLATNPDTVEVARKCGCRRVELQFDFGLPDSFYASEPRRKDQCGFPLRLLWTATLTPRKALVLALDAMQHVSEDVHLTIVGGASESIHPNELIRERSLEKRVSWMGKVGWDKMKMYYLESDCLLFTSLRDSSGAQLVEAAGLGLAILCLDHQGAAAFVTEDMGYRVPVTTPSQTALELARAIDRFARLPIEDRIRFSRGSLERARAVSWHHRIRDVEVIYRRAMGDSHARQELTV
jgi:glycosyltransferase involved in cell wall biosynthesis